MCGRYAIARPDSELQAELGAETVIGEAPEPSYNAAPGQDHRVVLERAPRDEPEGGGTRQLRSLRWGLIPSWAKDRKIGNRMINARAETITEKPAFKAAARRRRLLVPADGYFEWQAAAATEDGAKPRKQPYFLHRGGELLAFAGLYELWPDPDRPDDDPDKWVWTYTVLTTTAPDASGWIHERSPVVLPASFWSSWLDPAMNDPEDVKALLNSVPEPALEPRPVSSAVNNPRNNRPELVDAVEV